MVLLFIFIYIIYFTSKKLSLLLTKLPKFYTYITFNNNISIYKENLSKNQKKKLINHTSHGVGGDH